MGKMPCKSTTDHEQVSNAINIIYHIDGFFAHRSWHIESEKPAPYHREIETVIKESFFPVILTKLFPRTEITITIQELNDDGNLLSTCINATSMALSDAGIPLRTLLVASTVALDKDSDNMSLAPSKEMEDSARALFTLAFERSADQGVVLSRTKGAFTIDEYWKVLAAAQTNAQEVLVSLREGLQSKIQNRA